MQAIVLTPGVADSAALADWPEPAPDEGDVLLETLALGVCGTDAEIIRGEYGAAPAGHGQLVLGHECLARVLQAPPGADLRAGDLAVPMVRRPDPVPCESCAAGEWDLCRNGRYAEHGIKELHGFGRERLRLPADRLVRVDPRLGQLGVLLEPASILAKAWEHIDHIARRGSFQPRRVLVTGAGPIGLLAALMGRQRGLEVAVLDRVVDGLKPQLVRDLGAAYHAGDVAAVRPKPDVAVECTGVGRVVFDVIRLTTPCGIVCLTGVSYGGRKLAIDMSQLNAAMVLENDVVFGTVNANRRHYEAAAASLAAADPAWLARLITRRVPLAEWRSALQRTPHDVKVVITFSP